MRLGREKRKPQHLCPSLGWDGGCHSIFWLAMFSTPASWHYWAEMPISEPGCLSSPQYHPPWSCIRFIIIKCICMSMFVMTAVTRNFKESGLVNHVLPLEPETPVSCLLGFLVSLIKAFRNSLEGCLKIILLDIKGKITGQAAPSLSRNWAGRLEGRGEKSKSLGVRHGGLAQRHTTKRIYLSFRKERFRKVWIPEKHT